ncbi:hypothetical protein BKM63_17770 [Flavobacterium johnsoniae]|uniref:Uncharacterized protein n=1 Tax=Flavobacterium johnsoniae TaxID=986 RepID=A0A1J7BPT9_FLAJO|nr:hypothetical protein BKM63_17770 [Flavobacterium johnsoniae]
MEKVSNLRFQVLSFVKVLNFDKAVTSSLSFRGTRNLRDKILQRLEKLCGATFGDSSFLGMTKMRIINVIKIIYKNVKINNFYKSKTAFINYF